MRLVNRGSVAVLALPVGVALLAAGVAGGAMSAAQEPDPVISVQPANNSQGVPTDAPVVVTVSGGRLKQVTVHGPQGDLQGRISADATRWRGRRTTLPGTVYTVTALAVDAAGKPIRTSSTFTTVKPVTSFGLSQILPSKEETGLTVGVGMPIMLTFDHEVTDRVSVERNLLVRTSKPVEGAWHWFDSRHVDFRPMEYWPANTRVRLEARLNGARGGPGLYGGRDYTVDFKIGRSQITSGSTDEHHLSVRRDGDVIRSMPMSAGQGGAWKYYTTSGVHLAMSRERVTTMVSPGIGPGQSGYYRMTVYNTVRISNSGEYVHSAPWSVGSQGYSNVSHGCVNISPSDAAWFIRNTLIGDPIIITGSPRKLEPMNGWGHWQESWKEWLQWSAIKAGPTDDL